MICSLLNFIFLQDIPSLEQKTDIRRFQTLVFYHSNLLFSSQKGYLHRLNAHFQHIGLISFDFIGHFNVHSFM
jgi:hypothetical protein